jgi:hypothetical protein
MASFLYLGESHADIIDAPLLLLRFGAMRTNEVLHAPGKPANLSKDGISSVALRPILLIALLFFHVLYGADKNLLIPYNYLYQ